MSKVIINGQFLTRRMTGQERFAYEVVTELDKIVPKDSIELVMPKQAESKIELKNIKIMQVGKFHGILWEQIDFAIYAIKHKALSINLCSIMPVLKPGIICIHDLSYKVNPQYFKNIYGRLSKTYHKIFYNLAWKFSPLVYTVSEYSKQQMIQIYHVDSNKIHVIPNGWQHFLRVEEDESIFEQYPALKKKQYYFVLGSLAPNKNIQWVLEVAKKHANSLFLIAGKSISYGNLDVSRKQYNNIIFLGYISDNQIKTLMKNCKAFLFPSKFEGFGIPPLEALSVGAKIIVSNASCLPEIYENAAIYIDPDDYDVDLDNLTQKETDSSQRVLEKYSFQKAAKIIYDDLTALEI